MTRAWRPLLPLVLIAVAVASQGCVTAHMWSSYDMYPESVVEGAVKKEHPDSVRARIDANDDGSHTVTVAFEWNRRATPKTGIRFTLPKRGQRHAVIRYVEQDVEAGHGAVRREEWLYLGNVKARLSRTGDHFEVRARDSGALLAVVTDLPTSSSPLREASASPDRAGLLWRSVATPVTVAFDVATVPLQVLAGVSLVVMAALAPDDAFSWLRM